MLQCITIIAHAPQKDLKRIEGLRQRFRLPPPPEGAFETAASAILDDTGLVLCTGLLFQAFKSAKEKQALRQSVVTAYAVLREQAHKERLPPALLKRAEQALQFQVPVAK